MCINYSKSLRTRNYSGRNAKMYKKHTDIIIISSELFIDLQLCCMPFFNIPRCIPPLSPVTPQTSKYLRH